MYKGTIIKLYFTLDAKAPCLIPVTVPYFTETVMFNKTACSIICIKMLCTSLQVT